MKWFVKLLASMLLVSLSLPGQEHQPGFFPLDESKLQSTPFDLAEYAEFARTMDKFDRKLGGCSEHSIHAEECVASQGVFDAKLWRKVQRLGWKVLQLPNKTH